MLNTRVRVSDQNAEQEQEKNIAYYKKLADKGDSDAMVKTGEMAEEVQGDYSYDGIDVLEWYRMAAVKGNISGMMNFCRCNAEYGFGTIEDAEKYANMAMTIGGPVAADTALWMGSCYGGYQDDSYSDVIKGIYWYEKAVELNEESGFAAERIADLYYEGKLVQKDLVKAKKYYEIAVLKNEYNSGAREKLDEIVKQGI